MSTNLPFYLGQYQVVSELGAGGFATVFKAIVQGELGFERPVALKVLHAHVTKGDPEIVKMLADEARLMAMMQHPNIVYVQWFGQLDHPDEGRVFAMLMEFVQGRTLRSLLEEGRRDDKPLPLSVVLDVYIDVARALAFAHTLKDAFGVSLALVHRDLKPDNVMVSAQGVVKLLDFGIAKATGRLASKTATDMVRGTVQYMSPEQVKGSEGLDFRSDLFSFGSMLYEAVTGQRLIDAETVISALHQVASFQSDEALVAIGRDAPGLAHVFEKLLDSDPDKRFATTDQLVQELEQVRRSIDSPVSTSTFLRERVSPLGDTAAVPTPAQPGSPSGTEDTVAIDSSEQGRASGAAAAQPEGEPWGELIDQSTPPPEVPPTAAMPVDRARPPQAAPPPSRPEPDDTLPLDSTGSPAAFASGAFPAPGRSWLPWVAAPLVLILGAVLGYVVFRVLEQQPMDELAVAEADLDLAPADLALADAGEAIEAEPADAVEAVDAEPEGDEPVLAALEEPEAVDAEPEEDEPVLAALDEPEAEEAEEAEPRAGSSTRRDDARRLELLSGGKIGLAGGSAVEPSPEAEPSAQAVTEPGRLRLSADHPFEVSVKNTRYTARDARRGISLPPGSYEAKIVCLQCPEGLATSMTVSVELSSGETTTRVVTFPESK